MSRAKSKNPVNKNSTFTEGKQLENSYPLNFPMSGVFDSMGGGGGVTPLSQPFEVADSTSYNLMSLQRVLLSYVYVLHGPLRTLVDQPPYDAFRGGFKIKTKEVSPEELKDLTKELKKLKVQNRVIDALRWDRLFGGAGIIINVDQDYKTPLNLDAINESSKLSFKVADRWELAWNGTPNADTATFGYYGLKIDQSRVAKIVGEEPPSLVRQRLQGWGMSAIECVMREISQYFKNNNVIFELLDEAKVDIWKIKGFNSQILSAIAQGKTAKRIQLATRMKNFLNAITLDSEDDYEQKQVTFTGLAEMLEQIRIGMAAAVRMPMSKIFGLASSGFSSGEDDLENYAAIVEGVRERAENIFDLIVPVVMMKVWGFVPDDWTVEWNPVRTLTAEQIENVKTQKFNRANTLATTGMLTPQEFMQYLQDEEIYLGESAVLDGSDPEPLLNPMMGDDPGGGEGGGEKKTSMKAKTEKEPKG